MHDMNSGQRLAVSVLVVAAVLASGWWLWGRLAGSLKSPAPVATPISMPPTVPAMLVTPPRVPRGYRLAGVAVGEPESFAVVEAPNGANALYRTNAEIPGLGRLVRIEAERVIVQSDAGQIELWLMPAATPTPTRIRTPTGRPTPPQTAGRTPMPTRPPAAAASAPGSTPSIAPGSPAS